jgi:hypothetical protein
MHLARQDALSRAALSQKEYGRFALGSLEGDIESLPHRRRPRGDVDLRPTGDQPGFQLRHAPLELLCAFDVVQDVTNLIGSAGLWQVIESSATHRFDGGFHRRICGYHDDRRPWRDTQNLLKHIQPALLAELKVEKYNLIVVRFQLLDRQRSACRSHGLVPHRLERQQERTTDVLLIVNNQSTHAGFSIGSLISNRSRSPVESGSCCAIQPVL